MWHMRQWKANQGFFKKSKNLRRKHYGRQLDLAHLWASISQAQMGTMLLLLAHHGHETHKVCTAAPTKLPSALWIAPNYLPGGFWRVELLKEGRAGRGTTSPESCRKKSIVGLKKLCGHTRNLTHQRVNCTGADHTVTSTERANRNKTPTRCWACSWEVDALGVAVP